MNAGSPLSSFPSTCWSLVRAGASPGETCASGALDDLARAYWQPVQAYLRADLDIAAQDAEDLTQDFFAWVLESGFLQRAHPSRGTFRSFVKHSLRNYVTDQFRKKGAWKRGGREKIESLHGSQENPSPPPSDSSPSPAEILDQAWRAELIEQALDRTREELEQTDRTVVFDVFQKYFLEPATDVDYQAIATEQNITKTDVSNYLMRAKRLFRTKLRGLVQETVTGPADLQEELTWLFGSTAS